MKEEKKLPTLKIGGREIPLFYSALEMAEIQKDIGCTSFQLNEEVFGIHQEDEDDPSSLKFGILDDGDKMKKFGTLIRILGNAGLEEQGKDPDLTDKWILRHMKPGMVMPYVVALVAVISEGNQIESVTKEAEGTVDETLEEQNAKKQQGN
jgi:hypothetical protein